MSFSPGSICGFSVTHLQYLQGNQRRLSPFPAALCFAMEPLAVDIRSSQDIQSIQFGYTSHKLCVFAGDLILFITEPRMFLPNLHLFLTQFHHISGLEVHFSKSKALNVSLPSNVRDLQLSHTHVRPHITILRSPPHIFILHAISGQLPDIDTEIEIPTYGNRTHTPILIGNNCV